MHKLLLLMPFLLACNPFIRNDEDQDINQDSIAQSDTLSTQPANESIKPGLYMYYLMDDYRAEGIEEADQKLWLEGKIEQLQLSDYSGELTRNSGNSSIGAHENPHADLFVIAAFNSNPDPDSTQVSINDVENPSLNWQNRQLPNGQVIWILRWQKESYFEYFRDLKDDDIIRLYSPEKLQSYQSSGKDNEHNLKSGKLISLKIRTAQVSFSAFWHVVFNNGGS